MKIGFIGQGFIGKSYADDFEDRGYSLVRYALEEMYVHNKEAITACDVVFIAVPTPTTSKGFDSSIVASALSLVGKGKIAVIKSTLIPGTTDELQQKNPDKIVLFSPEFLIARSAKKDAKKPIMNIVGFPSKKPQHKKHAKKVLSLLPKSSYEQIMTASEAELFKYTHNVHGVFRILFSNFIYDVAEGVGADYKEIQKAMNADPYMTKDASYYNNPVHQSGRGAGGVCFIKDFAAFIEMYKKTIKDVSGLKALQALEKKNVDLLTTTNKDLDLLQGVYGKKTKKK